MSLQVIELERRWVLPSLPDFPSGIQRNFATIRQHYVPIGGLMARLRRSRDLITERKRYQLTFKQGQGMERLEWEDDIPNWLYYNWREQAIGGLGKTRIEICLPPNETPFTLVLDVFSDKRLAGLVIAEVENVYRGLPNRLTVAKDKLSQYQLSSWIGPAREVTDDSRYGNQSLAISGRPQEGE